MVFLDFENLANMPTKSCIYKDEFNHTIVVRACQYGWTVVWDKDLSTHVKRDDTVEGNFDMALQYVKAKGLTLRIKRRRI